MSTKIKPCNAPCPKCGSGDINRRNRIKGNKFDIDASDNFNMIPYCEWDTFPSAFRYAHRVIKECITHHCRCCHYNWATATLPTKKTKQ